MSASLAVSGDAESLALAGMLGVDGGEVLVLLGDAAAPTNADAIRWHDGSPGAGQSERQIAPEGDGLWRRAPWPAADALFELPLPGGPQPVLVAGGRDSWRAQLSDAIRSRGITVSDEPRLTATALERAASVLLLPSAGVAGEALPLEAMAVLAARRLLIVPRCRVAFGLQPGIDHLQFALSTQAADLVESQRRQPQAYAAMRAWGTFAARRHRASDVYRALALDLELEGFARKS